MQKLEVHFQSRGREKGVGKEGEKRRKGLEREKNGDILNFISTLHEI